MNVTFITTVGHNVGDDFVRDGIAHLLRQVIGSFNARLVHKHFPVTARRGAERLHEHPLVRHVRKVRGLRGDRLSRWLDARPLRAPGDAILDADLVVQCGAPVYWLNPSGACEDNEWYGPLVRRRWSRVRDRVRLLNLGAGACQPFDSDGGEFAAAPRTLEFIREFFAACTLTTVRDELSEKILSHAGLVASRLPCPSLFARRWHGIETGSDGYIALNFMARGGHYDLDGRTDPARWRRVFTEILRTVQRSARCVLVCHDVEERELAHRWFPDVDRFWAATAADYLRFYAGARSGILNRVHGAFALASFGRPAVVIGADSRARMAEELGLPVFPVVTAEPASILHAHSAIVENTATFASTLAALAAGTEHRYLELLRHALTGSRS